MLMFSDSWRTVGEVIATTSTANWQRGAKNCKQRMTAKAVGPQAKAQNAKQFEYLARLGAFMVE
jgi:SOS response regulatory protein OraA/RecX